jgi:endonuclease YncB( thermonuclease family)
MISKNGKRILLASFIFIQTISAQYVKVVKILDSNLFELDDGRKIKLAGIDAPQLNNPIPLFAETADAAVAYYKESLLRRSVALQTISKMDSKNYELVYLWLKYPLEDIDLNQRFLERGFGKFINNVDSNKKTVLIEAEKYAAINHNGIWKYYKPNETDTLDGDLKNNDAVQLLFLDSTRIQTNFRSKPIYFAVPLELLAGSGITVVSTISSSLLAVALTRNGWAALFITVYGGTAFYLFGFPYGIYLVAKEDNPNLSYLEMLGCGLGLTAITGGIASLFSEGETRNTLGILTALSPIIGSLLYVHAFPPDPTIKEKLKSIEIEEKSMNNFKDYYNATMNFRIELMRIYF